VVELTAQDYRDNRDPVMEAIREYVPRPSLADRLEEAFGTGGFEAAVAAYHEFKDDPANALVDTEDVMNQAGYALLGMQLHAEAIIIFKLNVEAYPGSSNAYDSLAEAYMENGDTELAIENYEKSLELNPANTNAVTKLEELHQ
jgi:D-alanyl-D-alanine-carboxypeptidase/D-alanyl-D-alanine-endopeptidase